MYIEYKQKKPEQKLFMDIDDIKLEFRDGEPDSQSMLIKGDNLKVMKHLIQEKNLKGKVDLVYIDPPFGTKNLFKVSEKKANSISRSNDGEIAYDDSLVNDDYLEFIRERLILIRELLSEKGSVYVHIDCKVGHYIKVIMDEIFGRDHFINDLTRIKCNPKNFERKGYGNTKDMILFYSKTSKYIWHLQTSKYDVDDVARLFKKVDQDGRRYTTVPVHAPGETKNGKTGGEWKGMLPPKGRHWRVSPQELDELDSKGLIEWSRNGVPRRKIFAEERKLKGKKIQDILDFKDPQNPNYPTEKNMDLIKLFIRSSSDEGSLVLDCFAGSGTTILSSIELGRKWIGIDSSDKAIETIRGRLKKKQSELISSDYGFYEAVDLGVLKETRSSILQN